MTESDVERHLRTAETGVLSLADGGRAYALPVHCHYDGATVAFRLSDDGDSEKLAFLEATTEACFVCYGATNGESWSVLVRGDVTERTSEVDPTTVNERFGPTRIFDEDIGSTEVRLYELVPTSVTGRKTPRYG